MKTAIRASRRHERGAALGVALLLTACLVILGLSNLLGRTITISCYRAQDSCRIEQQGHLFAWPSDELRLSEIERVQAGLIVTSGSASRIGGYRATSSDGFVSIHFRSLDDIRLPVRVHSYSYYHRVNAESARIAGDFNAFIQDKKAPAFVASFGTPWTGRIFALAMMALAVIVWATESKRSRAKSRRR